MRGLLMLLLVFGCDDSMVGGMGGAGGTGGSGGHHPPPTPPPPNDIRFDLSGLNRYVTGNPAAYAISGLAASPVGRA